MKKYNSKIAMILVLSIVLALAIPALAAKTTRIYGKYEDPDIQIIIPTTGHTVINPYSLPVKVTADDNKTKLDMSLENQGQIATRPLVGVNLSNIDLQIGATVSADETGDFSFSSTPVLPDGKTKKGQVFFQVINGTDDTYNLGYDTDGEKDKTVCGGFDGEKVVTKLNALGVPTYDSTKDILLVSSGDSNRSVTQEGMATLPKATTSGEQTTPENAGYFLARMGGNVSKRPTEEWVTSDGFNATITWIIEPSTGGGG